MNPHLLGWGFLFGVAVTVVAWGVMSVLRDAFDLWRSRKLPRFASDIDPVRYDEYEAAIARLRKRFSVKKVRRPRKPKLSQDEAVAKLRQISDSPGQTLADLFPDQGPSRG